MVSQVTPFLWFDKHAEEAANFYVSLFPNSEITTVTRFPASLPDLEGQVMTVDFTLNGMKYVALNGSGGKPFSETVSFQIYLDTQEEIDHFYDAFKEGGNEMACGWVADRFGVVWQVTPKALMQFVKDPNPNKVNKTMAAMMEMKKLIIADLQAAYES